MIECVRCEEEVNPKRVDLGYKTCLDCGAADAKRLAYEKARQVAPAFNKGAYQYITSRQMARDIGR
jgi:ribosomal protein L37AE/L43A